jgi:hypothetical protein
MIAERHRGASSRLSGATRGLIAGAAGACAPNTATYIDMLVRGRPPSELPAQVAARIAERAEIDLARGDPGAAGRATVRVPLRAGVPATLSKPRAPRSPLWLTIAQDADDRLCCP